MNELIDKAIEARRLSYSPYSNFQVGASLLLSDGTYIKGCNIENASYGLTNCAERTALFSALAKGYTKDDIKAIAIVASSESIVAPCGACRQVITELMSGDCLVHLYNLKTKESRDIKVSELLPLQFSADNLE